MNSPKEPEPRPRCPVSHALMGYRHKARRILRIATREGEGYVQGIEVEEFIGG
jgi:hypothetical protein